MERQTEEIYQSIYSSYIVEQKSDNKERKKYDKGVGATLRGMG